MTKYMGSKAAHADEILQVILAKRRPGQCFVEPFVGGANVMCRVPDADGPRIGADINGYMIALHKALAAGWHPPKTMTEESFFDIRSNPDRHSPELVAFVETGCTFGSSWGSGFITDAEDGTTLTRPQARELDGHIYSCAKSAKSCLRDAPGLVGVKFIHSSYDSLEIPPQSLVYCDPPYIGTTSYEGSAQNIKVGESAEKNVWRAYKFWRWADRLVDEGHTVFVSEYEGPTATAFPPVIAPEVKAELKRLADIATAKQRDLKCPSAEMQAAVDEWIAAQREANETATSRKDEWKVVWEKEVTVTLNSIYSDAKERKKFEDELQKIESMGDKITNKQRTRTLELRRMIVAVSGERKIERLFHRPCNEEMNT